ncbi:exported hypothetical protein [groundwater metagenome]|uniref:Uncharacterized protein n=1 Tax=groundwater metagenome TaxID=717931 RepID=A0A098ECG0_9ZZZZ
MTKLNYIKTIKIKIRGEKKMKNINKTKTGLFVLLFVCCINFVCAELPKEEPLWTIGEDYLVVENGNPSLFFLFDNTEIYVDLKNDGVWEFYTVQNAGVQFTPSIAGQSITYGDKVHTSKPVIYYRGGNRYDVVPPLGKWKSEYYAYGETWYAIVEENTTIYVDDNYDGTIDRNISAVPFTANSVAVNNFGRVFSDKPFYFWTSDNTGAQKGTDFYLPWNGMWRILVLENNTEIKIDKNNDGFYDGGTVTWNKGVVSDFTGLSFADGAHLRFSKPVVVFLINCQYYCCSYYSLPSSSMLGNDFWSLWSGDDSWYQLTGFFNNATGIAANTTYYADKVIENDLISNYNGTLISNQVTNTPVLGWIHIWGNMPFGCVYRYPYCYVYTIPQSSITSTTYGTQKYLGANEITEIYVRVFNPFANTTISNVNITVKIPSNFSLPNGNNLTLNIKKLYLRNDTVIENDTLVVTPTNTGSNYEFTITSVETSLLNSLDVMKYIDIRYQVVTPSEYGQYKFEPVHVDYTAETWNMPQ